MTAAADEEKAETKHFSLSNHSNRIKVLIESHSCRVCLYLSDSCQKIINGQ